MVREPGQEAGRGWRRKTPKLQYLKNLMLKYLGTDEGEAREHMERAIATVLQFLEEVRTIDRLPSYHRGRITLAENIVTVWTLILTSNGFLIPGQGGT